MHTDTDIRKDLVTITPEARNQFVNIMKENNNQYQFLRLGVNASGCCGYTYIMMFENNKNESDHQVDLDGLSVLISKESLQVVKGANIDFQQSGQAQGFIIDNPKKQKGSSCNCSH